MTDTDNRPNPFQLGQSKPGTHLGDYVTVPAYGYKGRVCDASYGCPESDGWKAMQSYDVSGEETKSARWVSILVHCGGSVTFPETMVEPCEPFLLKNNHAPLLWAEGVAREF